MTKTFKVLALVLFVLAGHTTLVPSMAIAIQENSKPQVAKLSSVKSISLSGEGAAAELVIALTTPATYTSYKTTAPLRLVLDLSQTAQGTINYPILLNKGNFKTVSANQFDTEAGVLTRIDVELVKDAEAVITASATKPGELRISFPIIEQKTASFKKDSIDKDNTIIAKQNVQTETKNSSNATPSPAETLSQRALSSISVKNDTIILKVDGGVADYNSFQLSKPDRFVIDLLNTTLSMSSHLIPLNTSGIASARIGVYPDKVRVVLDSINGNFPETSVVKSDQGLSVKIISKPEKNVVEEVKLKPK
ncbi:AMIN domain-containing protein, partial [Candidatus Nomurabacteria bacterium]|nr:AMIN domain-containing protein [Candidatus Nomurabacteria bacterium]